MQFDKSGVCMGCLISDKKLSNSKSDYLNKKKIKSNNLESKQYSKSDYDCIASVSGGKDSITKLTL